MSLTGMIEKYNFEISRLYRYFERIKVRETDNQGNAIKDEQGYPKYKILPDTPEKQLTKQWAEKLKQKTPEHLFNENSVSVLKKRYLKKDEKGNILESPRDLVARVSSYVAFADIHYLQKQGVPKEQAAQEAYKTAEEFDEMIRNCDFMPCSPTLMNSGRDLLQLFACFVLPIGDSIEEIFEAVKQTAIVHKSGGGTGFSFSKLRKRGNFIATTYGRASGPPSFMKVFNEGTDAVNQGGFRRGANMGVMRVDHPDILQFMFSKEYESNKDLTNFNLSVGLTDEFMQAYYNNENFVLKNPIDGRQYALKLEDILADEQSVIQGTMMNHERNLVVDKDNKIVYFQKIKRNEFGEILYDKKTGHPLLEQLEIGEIDSQKRVTSNARIIFDEITKLAWKNGEPGILFLDRINKDNPTPTLGEIEATNPCGEQPLLPYEACNLGSVNLGNMLKRDNQGNLSIDYDKLGRTTKALTHFLDNAIDMSKFPLEQITEMVHTNRKIGLGIMGFSDLLIKLGIPYNSEKAVNLAETIMEFVDKKSKEESHKLAEQRGVFPSYHDSIYAKKGITLRNATTTTIAPTGTISIIAGASSGVEPIFAVIGVHTDAGGQKRVIINKAAIESFEQNNIDIERVKKCYLEGKTLKEMDFVPDHLKKSIITANEIPYEWHVKMQAAFQKHTDNAVSKTINFPNSAKEEIKNSYLLAYKLGCKGLTVYRDGSRVKQVFTKAKKEENLEEKVLIYRKAKDRPDELQGRTIRKKTGCGNIFVTINYEEKNGKKDVYEVFSNIGKAGGCAAAQSEAVGRALSYALRIDADPLDIAKQLIGIRCHKPIGFEEKQVLSCPDAIGKAIFYILGNGNNNQPAKQFAPAPLYQESGNAIKQTIKEEINKTIRETDASIAGGACQECGSPLKFTSGCLGGVCTNEECGFSSCG